MGQVVSKMAGKKKKEDSQSIIKPKMAMGERYCECLSGTCTYTHGTAAEKDSGGQTQNQDGKAEASSGKKPETPEETLQFLRRFIGS